MGRRARKAPYSELGTSGQSGQPCLCIIHIDAIARSQTKAEREVTCKGERMTRMLHRLELGLGLERE